MKSSRITYAPGYTSETHPRGPKAFTDEELIDAFFASYIFWVFRYGEKLINDTDAGFAILLLMYPYFQMIGRCIKRMSSDIEEFRLGILSVFASELSSENPDKQEIIADYLYYNLRSELAHGNLMGKGIVLFDGNTPALAWIFDQKTRELIEIVINPRLWISRINEHIIFYKHSLNGDQAKKRMFLKHAKSNLKRIIPEENKSAK